MLDLKKIRRLPKGADLSHIQPDLHVLAVPIGALAGHPDNPRLHGEANRKAIAGSLRKYLQRKPVVANLTEQGLLIEAGHGVYGEMLAAGSQYIACTIVEDDPITELGFMIADNQSGDLSENDNEKLAPILRQLIEAGEDVEEIGWDEAAVRGLLGDTSGDGDESGDAQGDASTPDGSGDGSSPDDKAPVDRAAELQKEWSTVRGQLWEIPSKTVRGKCHRVMCGDCRESADVKALLDGQKVNVAFTSPPYASQRKYDEESGFKPIKPDAYVEWFGAVQANVRTHLASDGSWFVNIKEHCEDGQRHLYVKDLTIAHVRQWGWRFVDELVWKRYGLPGGWKNRFKNCWEPIIHFSLSETIKCDPSAVAIEPAQSTRGDKRRVTYDQKPHEKASTGSGFADGAFMSYSGAVLPGNVIECDAIENGIGHSAAFPVALPTFFIKAFSDPSGLIFDPFLGSGTTMIAAEREGRISCGMELSPKYLAVILERAKKAGLEPRLVNV